MGHEHASALRNSPIISGIRTMSRLIRSFPMEKHMPDNNTPNNDPSFFDRILSNDAAKKGLATAVAGVLIAAVTELVWPSNS